MEDDEFHGKKAQQEMCKRAMEAAWVATCGIGMVLGPAIIAVEMGGVATREMLDSFLDDWQGTWREAKPNERLSPILLRFEENLQSVRFEAALSAEEMLAQIKEAYTATTRELFEYNNWMKSAGPLIDFDAEKHEAQAIKRGQKYWEPTVKQLFG